MHREAEMDPVSGSPWASVPGNRLLPIRVSTEPAGAEWTPENPAEEPVSPTARAMEDIGIYIVVTIGLDTRINLSIFRAGIESLLARCPRLGCIQTVNDVLVAVTSAALSRYYFRKSGDTNTSKICLRSLLPVNTRPATSLQTYVNVIESDKRNEVTWGNKLGHIILPFYLAMHDDPLAYIRKAKKVLDRKKRSLEVIFTYKIGLIFTKVFGVKVGTSIFRCLFTRTTIVFSNMVGPAEQVELCGHPVAFLAPSVYGIPEALIIHYQSYRSTIKIILSIDEDKFPDYHQLLDDFDQTLTVMKDAASRLSTSTKND
uniref:O-acyltransferase WSD1 C-terminal domain-containing protein n=1 Tax=Triticum urartu TaxID=4572 RepID=A0A8R7V103_TRIUA